MERLGERKKWKERGKVRETDREKRPREVEETGTGRKRQR